MLVLFIQLCLVTISHISYGRAECQPDVASMFWNAYTPANYSLLQSADKDLCEFPYACDVGCKRGQGFAHTCCLNGVCACDYYGDNCLDRLHYQKRLIGSFATLVVKDSYIIDEDQAYIDELNGVESVTDSNADERMDCLPSYQYFYYGELIVDKVGTFEPERIAHQLMIDADGWSFQGSGVVELKKEEAYKQYSFVHKYHPKNLTDPADPSCYNRRSGYIYVNLTAFIEEDAKYTHIGSASDTQFPTCAEETSCLLVNCTNFGVICNARGTYICVPDASSCPSSAITLTTTSTLSCSDDSETKVYYGEITTTKMTGSDIPFKSTRELHGDFWIFRGMGTVFEKTSGSTIKKYFYFSLKFNKKPKFL